MMLISFEKQCIFIHIYKVAGTSLRSALFPYEPTNVKFKRLLGKILASWGIIRTNQVYTASLFNWKCFHAHAKAFEVQQRLDPKIYNNFYKFSFVRNPWDWQVSLYHYALRTNYHHSKITRSFKDFDEYIEWRVSKDVHLQKEFLINDKGELIVDFIGKLENLERDFKKISNRLVLNANAALPHVNKTKHKDYRAYYNNYTKRLVNEAFIDDIETFGYTFDRD